jgi:hypothetical protein
MADGPVEPEPGDNTGGGLDREPSAGTPRWVKVFGLIALVVVVLFVVVLLVDGAEHGPSRHSLGSGSGAPLTLGGPPSSTTDTQP